MKTAIISLVFLTFFIPLTLLGGHQTTDAALLQFQPKISAVVPVTKGYRLDGVFSPDGTDPDISQLKVYENGVRIRSSNLGVVRANRILVMRKPNVKVDHEVEVGGVRSNMFSFNHAPQTAFEPALIAVTSTAKGYQLDGVFSPDGTDPDIAQLKVYENGVRIRSSNLGLVRADRILVMRELTGVAEHVVEIGGVRSNVYEFDHTPDLTFQVRQIITTTGDTSILPGDELKVLLGPSLDGASATDLRCRLFLNEEQLSESYSVFEETNDGLWIILHVDAAELILQDYIVKAEIGDYQTQRPFCLVDVAGVLNINLSGCGFDCDDDNMCTIDMRDPDTGECIHIYAAEGQACDPATGREGYCDGHGQCVEIPESE